MGFFKGLFRTMQDGDQIDHRIVPRQQARKRCTVVGVGLDDFQHGQHQQVPRVGAPACHHRHAALRLDQFFTKMPANKTGTAKDQDFFHKH